MADETEYRARPSERREHVRAVLAQYGLALDDPSSRLRPADAEAPALPSTTKWLDEREDWVRPPGCPFPLSPALYARLGGAAGRDHEPEVPAMPDGFDPDLASYEALRK